MLAAVPYLLRKLLERSFFVGGAHRSWHAREDELTRWVCSRQRKLMPAAQTLVETREKQSDLHFWNTLMSSG